MPRIATRALVQIRKGLRTLPHLMDLPSSSVRKLARQLLAMEAASTSATNARMHEAVRVCEKLRIALTRFAGADGFASLLRRTLALARVEVPSLNDIQIKPDGSLEDLATIPDGNEAAVAITAHLLELLVIFIGHALTMRLVREAWPDASFDESH